MRIRKMLAVLCIFSLSCGMLACASVSEAKQDEIVATEQASPEEQKHSPEATALRERITEAQKKSSEQSRLGCYGPIGGSKDGSQIIFLESVEDRTTKVLHETETRGKADGTDLVQTKEQWLDQTGKRMYYRDENRKSYMFIPEFDSETLTTYLSLGYYLEYTPNIAEYVAGEPTVIDRYNGGQVTCDIIRTTQTVEADYIPFDSGYTGETVQATSEETADLKGDEEPSAEENSGRIVTLEYAIGQEDGLIYRITHGGEVAGTRSEKVLRFFYPAEPLTIPTAYTKKPVLAEGVVLIRKGLQYGSYYKGEKTCLEVVDYQSENSKSISVLSQIKLDKRNYTVNGIAWRAFWKHTNLKKITLPRTVTVIEEQAFSKCPSLKKMIIKNKTLRKKLQTSKAYRKKIGISKAVKVVG